MDASPVPVVLFAYARSVELSRVLACLRENRVPLVYVFVDGAKGAADAAAVAAVRTTLRAVDWTEIRITEREKNLGLGRNILAGVGEVAAKHDAFIVWEDDLLCSPGTYAWLVAALRHYAEDRRVMSVTGWTHPRVRPPDSGNAPYFDGRAECWIWGAWRRSWAGMRDQDALAKMAAVARAGAAVDAYGADLPRMARNEARRNLWAVRWLYHHLQHGGLCLRPPFGLVKHIGLDAAAANTMGEDIWADAPLRPAPPAPAAWPEPVVAAECASRWRAVYPPEPKWRRVARRVRNALFAR